MSSKQVDERVVQMKFDNADFQKKTAETISTLDKLKAALRLDGFKGLKDVNDSIKDMDMSGVSKSVDECSHKFSVLEIAGVTAIMRITSAAMDMGTKFIKSMSIDRVADGFSRYAQKTAAVQTIMAATAKDFNNVGEQMAYVNEQLDKLAWFTDETSYSFNEMVNNIGKFTSNNIKLDDAVTAMQGISTWAAVSGANINDANRAMYNLSQSVGAGAVKLIDWKSIENANMATYDFKKNVAETAVQMGTLSRAGDGVYKTMKGTTFTLAQFNQELDKGWFSSEVLLNTLNKYGGATEILYKLYETTGQTTKSILDNAEKFKNGDADFIKKWAEESETSVEELTELFAQLTDAQNELGLKSFRAAQEAKTFQEAIDATAEAVGSKWMKTFEIIFGSYEEAKALWSGFAEFLYDEFAESGNTRNEILEFWRENDEHLDGRTELLKGVVNLLNLIIKPLHAIKQGFSDAFHLDEAKKLGTSLAQATQRFAEFTEKIQPTEKVLKAFYGVAQAASEVFKTIVYLIGSLIKAIAPGVEPVQQVGDGLASIVLTISKYVYVAAQMIRNSKTIPVIFNAIGTVLRTVFTILKSLVSLIAGSVIFVLSKLKVVVSGLSTAISKLKDPFDKVLKTATKFKNGVVDSIKQNKALSKVYAQEKDQLKDVGSAMNSTAESSRELWDEMSIGERVIYVVVETLKKIPVILGTIGGIIGGAILTIVSKIGSVFKTVFTTIYDDFKNAETVGEGFKNLINDIKEGITGMLNSLGFDGTAFFEFIDTLVEKLKKLKEELNFGKIVAILFSVAILMLMSNISAMAKSISSAFTAVGGLFGNINKILKSKFLSKATPLLEVAKAIALVAASLALLTVVNEDGKLWDATKSLLAVITTMGVFTVIVMGLEKAIAKAGLDLTLPKLSTTMIALAGAIGILSASLLVLSKIPLSNEQEIIDFNTRLIAVIALMATLVAASASLSVWAPELSKNSKALLMIAASLSILVFALKSLGDITINSPEAVVASLAVLVMGLAGITKVAEGIKIRNALAVMAVAVAFRIAIPAIEQLADKISEIAQTVATATTDTEYIKKFLIAVALVIGGVIAASLFVTKAVVPLVSAVGHAAVEIGIGVFLLVQAANSLQQIAKELNKRQLAKVALTVAFLAGVIVSVIGLLKLLNGSSSIFGNIKGVSKLIGVSLLLVSFGATMILLAKAFQLVADAYKNSGEDSMIVCAGVIGGLGILIAVITKVAGQCQGVKGAIAAMTAVIASMAVMLISLTILTLFEWKELIAPTISLGVILGMLALVFKAIGTIQKVDMKIVTAMIGSLLVVAGSLVILSGMEWQSVAAAGGAMLLSLLALSKVLSVISKSSGLANPDKVANLVSVCFMIATIGSALALMATQEIPNVLVSAVAMGAILGVLSLVLLPEISKASGLANPKKIGVLLSVCAMLGSIAGAMYLISMIDTSKMLPTFLSLAGAVAVLALVVAGLSLVKAIDPMVLAGMFTVSACCTILALAATIMQDVNAVDFAIKIGVMAAALAVLTVLAGVFPQAAAALGALTGVLLGISAVLLAFGVAAVASGIGFTIICEAVKGMQDVDILGVAGGMLALAGSLLALTIGGAGLGLAALGMISAAIGIAALAGSSMLAATGLDLIAGSMERLQNVDIGSVAVGLLKLSGAFSVLSVAGIALPIAAAGMIMLAGAISIFSGSLSILSFAVVGLGSSAQMLMGFFQTIANGVQKFINVIGGFFYTIKSMFVKESGPMASAANANATLVGKSFEKGFRDATGFHSPVPLIQDFEEQIQDQMLHDAQTPAAAAANGDAVGQSWGAALWEKITGVFKKIIDGIKNLFGKITGIGEDLDLSLDDIGLNPDNFKLDNIIPDVSQYTQQFDDLYKNFEMDGLNYEDLMEKMGISTDGYTESAEGASVATADFGDAMGGAGSAAKETKRELTDMEKTFQNLADSMTNASDGIKNFKSISASNPFEAYEEKEEIDPKNVIDNMKNISKTTSIWMADLNTLWERGVHTNLLKYLEELGIEGRDMVAAFVKMSDEQLQEAQGLFNHNLGYSEENAEAMLNSMHRKLDQVQQWGHNIKTLIERGLDEGIVKKLADLGPDSADQVAAFASMTERQLQDANDMFAAAMQISADGAGSIIASFADTGDTAAQEFIQGINDGKYGYIEAGQGMGLTVLNALKESLDEHSASKETHQVGVYAGEGLNNGMADTYTQVSRTAYGLAQAVLNDFSITLSYDKLYKLGENAMAGLKAGIENKGAEAVSAAEGIAAKCAEIMAQKWDEHSPSRVMMKLGRFFSEGAAIGIEAGAQNMYNAAAIAAEGTVGAFEDVTSQVNDAIAFNCNPIITPKLDLSYIRSQMAEINSMFNDGTVGVNGNPQNGGKSSGQNGQQQITFTQNNYSPKALSRTEIYRYTHNQLSMAGGYIR